MNTIVKPVAAFETPDGQLFRREIEAVQHIAERTIADAFEAIGYSPHYDVISAIASKPAPFMQALQPLASIADPRGGRKPREVPLAHPTPERLREDAARVFSSVDGDTLPSRELLAGLTRLNSDSPWHSKWSATSAQSAMCQMAQLFRRLGVRPRKIGDGRSVYRRSDVTAKSSLRVDTR